MKGSTNMKTPKFPVAQYRQADGVPAVWLTHTNWLAIREGLVRGYIQQREYIGQREARKAAGKPERLDTWGNHFETCARDAALELFRIGYEAHGHIAKSEDDLTPDKLVALGDKCARRAADEQAKRLAEKERQP
jgi:hypothetical protein